MTGRAEARDMRVYVVTQYPSQANRRVMKVLALRDRVQRMTLVCEPGAPIFDDVLNVKKLPNPTAILSRLGLKGLRYALDARLYFPSPTILYARRAAAVLERAVAEDLASGRSVTVMTMTPPHELALIGLALKERFPSIRWVIDWQDLWSYDEYYFERVAAAKRRRLRAVELEVLNGCDVNVVTNEHARRCLVEHYGVSAKKVEAIPHPYDLAEIPGDSVPLPDGSRGAIRLGFLGHLMKPPKVPGDRVLQALAAVRASSVDLVFHVFGDEDPATRRAVEGLDWVVLHPRVAHGQSLAWAGQCDALALTLADLPNTGIIMHAKLPHYLVLRRPIIAMVPRASFVAELVRATGTGHVIGTDEDWGARLTGLFASSSWTAPKRREDEIARYSWERISSEWLAVIGKAE